MTSTYAGFCYVQCSEDGSHNDRTEYKLHTFGTNKQRCCTRKGLTRGRADHFGDIFPPMILTYDVVVNLHAKYLGQRSLRPKVIVRTHTDTHTTNRLLYMATKVSATSTCSKILTK